MDDGARIYYRSAGQGDGEPLVVPMAVYLAEALEPLAVGRRVIFYDPRGRGRSDAADTLSVSLDRQIRDLEQLRIALGIERMALLGWSGLAMEMAAYTIRHPDRVTRLVQVAAVPPRASQWAEIGGDARAERRDTAALRALEQRADAGEFAADQAAYCRALNALTMPSNFVDTTFVARVPDVCAYENEWPNRLGPYFRALLGSFGDYDWRESIRATRIPRLVIHGREDGVPLAGAVSWAAGDPNARLLIVSPSGHFPFIEQGDFVLEAILTFLAGEFPEGSALVPAERSTSADSSRAS
jgi:pimeloyl-ACP methyl ester carboxylesterase